MPMKDVNFAYMKNIIFLQGYHPQAGRGGRGPALIPRGSLHDDGSFTPLLATCGMGT